MLKKIKREESQEDKSAAELDALKNTDWVRRRVNSSGSEALGQTTSNLWLNRS